MTDRLPGGYALLSRPGVRAFAWDGAMGWLEDTLARHGTLEAWSRGTGGVELARGRGTVRALAAPVSGPDGRGRWVCRRYRRGGWMTPLGDRYLAWGSPRPFRELNVSVAARARGVRSPAVVAGAVYRTGVVYRADLVTEQVPEARSLASRLRAPEGDVAEADAESDVTEEDLLLRAGRAVASLERARIVHADASAGNILLAAAGPAWIVDLDRCRALPLEAPAPAPRARARLERSLRKVSAARGRSLSPAAWAALRAGYDAAYEEEA